MDIDERSEEEHLKWNSISRNKILKTKNYATKKY